MTVASSAIADARGRFHIGHLAAAALLLVSFGTFRRREIWELFTLEGFDAEVRVKLCVWMLLGAIAALLYKRVFSGLLTRIPLLPYALYLLLAFVSAIYSVSLQLTVYHALQLAILFALALAYAERMADWPRLGVLFVSINWIFLLVGLTGLVPSLNWRLLPGYQEAGFDSFMQSWRFGTPMGHFSQISIVAAMVAIVRAARLRRERLWRDLLAIGWMVLTVLLTVSRTAIIGLAAGMLVVAVLRRQLVPCMLALVVAGSLALAVPDTEKSLIGFLDRGQSKEEIESLTGRTSIYDSVIDNISRHWLLGYGYRANRFVILDEQIDGSGVSHAHNAVLEATAGLGVGGGAAAVFVLVSLFAVPFLVAIRERRNRLPRQSRRACEFAGLFPPVFAFSMLDSSFSLDANPFIFIFVAMLSDMAMYGHILDKTRPVTTTYAALSGALVRGTP